MGVEGVMCDASCFIYRGLSLDFFKRAVEEKYIADRRGHDG